MGFVNDFKKLVADACTRFGSQLAFSKKVGIPNATLERWQKEGLPGSFEKVARICDFLGVKIDLSAGSHAQYLPVKMAETRADSLSIEGIKGASLGDFLFPESFLREHGILAENAIMIRMTGPAMAPTLLHGDWVLVNLADKTPCDGQIFLVSFSDTDCFFRQAQRIPNGWQLSAHNPQYAPLTINGEHAESLNFLGRAIWIARRLN